MQSSIVQALASGTQSYGTRIRYDTYYGRPVGQEYPNGESVQVLYSSYGDAIAEKEPVSGVEYRRTHAVNARGQATQEVFGNGVTLTPTYQLQTGQLTGLTYSGMAGTLRQLGYGYDVFGNLKRQSLNSNASREDYSYDQLHRLVQSIRSGAASGTVNYGFDAVGNLTKKSDYSANTSNAYSYTGGSCGGGANAVKSVQLNAGGTRTYCYDANGNLTGDNAGLSLKYDHQNLPVVAQRGALRDDFRYGTDGMRTRSWGSDGARVYLPGYEHRTDTGETKVYIGDYAVISRTGSTRKVDYLLKDRLGSVDAVSNSSGVVTETRGYDAFGKPRSGTWNDLSPAKIGSTAVTPKGFTQHEHLNELELIHMNGRMYDYNVGRFMGVDPFIQFPLNSQSLNPYSYILNNPLSGTDPTGYSTCSADGNPADCAEGAGAGGEAKVYQQDEGSRIKTTVGTVKNNGDGSATFTNSAGQSKTFGGGNGSPAGQSPVGSSSRQDQAAQGSAKGATSNVSSPSAHGEGNSDKDGNSHKSGAISGRALPPKRVVVGFDGAGDADLPDNLAITNFGDEIGARMYDAKAIVGAPVEEALAYILGQDPGVLGLRVYVFGYSAGGDAALDLVNRLDEVGVQVAGLVTFDPHSPMQPWSYPSDSYDVPKNVNVALNIFQRNPNTTVAGTTIPGGRNPFLGAPLKCSSCYNADLTGVNITHLNIVRYGLRNYGDEIRQVLGAD